MASAPQAASSAEIIGSFVNANTPNNAKQHMPAYIAELTADCQAQCSKAFEEIRNAVREAEKSRFEPVRTSRLQDNVSIKFDELRKAIALLFQEKYGLKIELEGYNTVNKQKELSLTEFESLVNANKFPSNKKECIYLASTKFSWTLNDLAKIFPERLLFYSDYQADSTPLEQLLWDTRDTTASHTFKIEGRELKVHRDLLAVRSEYFMTKLLSGMKVDDEQDVSADTMEQAVHFFYKRQLPEGLTLKQLLELHRAGNKWIDEKLQKCVTQALGKWRDKNPLSKDTLSTYCDLALNTKAEFGLRFKEISRMIKEHVLRFVEDHKAWDAFDPLVTLDTYTKWIKAAEANTTQYPTVIALLHSKASQIIKQAAKESKEKRVPDSKV